jgi:hypothetical protein
MGVDGSQPRRALCLFGQETHQLFVRWCPAALGQRFARRQAVSALDGDEQHWHSRIETDTKLVVVHNAAPSDVARSRRTVERILERAHVIILFQETDAPPAFEADVGASCLATLRVCKEHRKMAAARLTMPCDSRWRALLTSCVVTARCGLDLNDACLLLRLSAALKQMDAGSAHAVLNALALPRAGA